MGLIYYITSIDGSMSKVHIPLYDEAISRKASIKEPFSFSNIEDMICFNLMSWVPCFSFPAWVHVWYGLDLLIKSLPFICHSILHRVLLSYDESRIEERKKKRGWIEILTKASCWKRRGRKTKFLKKTKDLNPLTEKGKH